MNWRPFVLFIFNLFHLTICQYQQQSTHAPSVAPVQPDTVPQNEMAHKLPQLNQFLDRPFVGKSRHEYKHSFTVPHLINKENRIYFWTVTGDALPGPDQLRLAPSMKSKSGMAWNNFPMTESEFWTVDLAFKITGQRTLGADGMAFWYTAIPGTQGSVFGSNDMWTGLGIFFDTFANDKNNRAPFIGMMVNDGTRRYDIPTDGVGSISASCQRNFRNTLYPVRVRIEYLNNKLTVSMHNGNAPSGKLEDCFTAQNIFLPRNGYFGLSAATGALVDDHDVFSFNVWSYAPNVVETQPVPAEERKFDQEYERQKQEYDRAREDYKKTHPQATTNEGEMETSCERGITQILAIVTENIGFTRRLDEMLVQIVPMQQNILQLIRQQKPVISPQAPTDSSAFAAQAAQNDALQAFQTARELSVYIQDIKNFVFDIQSRVIALDQRLTSSQHQQPSHQQPMNTVDTFTKSYLESIKREVEQIRNNQMRPQALTCPTLDSNCLSTTIFLVVLFLQSLLFVLYTMFKGRSEKAKFY